MIAFCFAQQHNAFSSAVANQLLGFLSLQRSKNLRRRRRFSLERKSNRYIYIYIVASLNSITPAALPRFSCVGVVVVVYPLSAQ